MTNMGLVGYNIRFLYAGIGAPGCTHDARLLRNTSIYQDIMNGGTIGEENRRLCANLFAYIHGTCT